MCQLVMRGKTYDCFRDESQLRYVEDDALLLEAFSIQDEKAGRKTELTAYRCDGCC